MRNMNGQFKAGDVVLGNWTLVQKIGEGSFGKVFEAHRQDFGVTYRSAIKIVTIPQNKSEITNAKAEGMDDASVTTYFKSVVENIVQEFALMSKLKGTANIVSYEDHSVVPHEGEIGWDIIIRMEFLKPLINHIAESTMTRRDIITLGIDMCKALELCQKYNIIHRDIKPENIFISENGDYKLGDFGIARTIEQTSGGLSKKGTYSYMAPEVYREDAYGSTVDIYSLGIVLYRLLNNNRTPFLPSFPAPIKHSDRERALIKRISGAKIGNPANDSGRLAEIVLKACAYEPKDRYSSPLQMRQELESILLSEKEEKELHDLTEGTIVVGKTSQNREYSEYRVNVDAHSFAGDGDDEKDPEGTVLAQRILAEENKQAEENESRKRTEQEKHAKNETNRHPLENEGNKNKSTLHRRKKGVAIFAGIIALLAVLFFAIVPKADKWEYNDDGNITKHTVYGAFGVIKSFAEYEYDENGNQTRYLSYENDTLKEIGEYNADGQLAKKIWYKDDGNVYETTEFEYDLTANITKQITTDANGAIERIKECEYDQTGIKTEKDYSYVNETLYIYIVQTYENGEKNQTFWTWCDEDGKYEVTYMYNDASGNIDINNPDGKIEYKYDDDGKLIQSDTYDKDGILLYSDVTKTDVATLTGDKINFLNQNGGKTWSHYRILNEPFENVTSLEIKTSVTNIDEGTPDGKWQVHIRLLDGEWKRLGLFVVREGTGIYTRQLDEPVSFDAYVCTRYEGANSWSGNFSQELSKVTYRIDVSGKDSDVSAQDNTEQKSNMVDVESTELASQNPVLKLVAISAAPHYALFLRPDSSVAIAGHNTYVKNMPRWNNVVAISAGEKHAVGVKSDGTVLVVDNLDGTKGSANNEALNVAAWKDIVAVAAGTYHTVGLKKDGTVLATGRDINQDDVWYWKDIIAVASGRSYAVGLKRDGTVLATGNFIYNVSEWGDIVEIAAGTRHVVGLKRDGTVLATGYDEDGQCKVSDWKDIVNVAAGFDHTVGLKKDGTVVATGLNLYGQCNVSDWKEIVAIGAGYSYTVGLKADGTIVYAGFHSYEDSFEKMYVAIQ